MTAAACVVVALLMMISLLRSQVIVPANFAYIVERLGKYRATLLPGFHLVVPFFDSVRYKVELNEQARTLPQKIYYTVDNVQVVADGTIYIKIENPMQATYGVDNYSAALTELAQTFLHRSISTLDSAGVFAQRAFLETEVLQNAGKAADSWGIKIRRFEIQNFALAGRR